MKNSRRIALRSALLILLVSSALFVLFAVERDPQPAGQLLAADRYLNLAQEARVDLDASTTFDSARTTLREARSAMMKQFGRPAFLRDYGTARRLITEGQKRTALAFEEARTESANRQARLEESIQRVRKEADEVRALLLNLPPRYHRALRHVVAAEMRVGVAERKLTSQESRDAVEQMDIARAEVNLALRDVRGLLLSFLERRPDWNEDLAHTLDWSRRSDGVAVVVDKLNHKTHVIKSGRTFRTYSCEFGPGWLDQKIRAGDQATPEGRYKITKETGPGRSRFYRALLLDYPNGEDVSRFRRLKASGLMSSRAAIGGMIEIHGNGGKGEDWTFGCVSLRDKDVDDLCKHVGVGTPVTIVGLWDEPTWLSRALQTADR